MKSQDYQAIPTGTSTIVTMALDGFNASSTLQIDIDGDGAVDGFASSVTDTVRTLKKVSEVLPTASHSHKTGRKVISKDPAGKVAGVSITDTEYQEWYYGEMLRLLKELNRLLTLLEIKYEK